MLCLDDLSVLASPLAQEVQRSLPVPAAVRFCTLGPDGSLQPLRHSAGHRPVAAAGTAGIDKPQLVAGQLILPLSLPSGEQAVAVIDGIDPALLKKMSPVWLQELQGALLERFAVIRLAYIDVETEIYNRRAADLV